MEAVGRQGTQPAVRPTWQVAPALLLALVGTLTTGACASSAERPAPRAEGPPRLRPTLVARHAREFDVDLARRPAGSQQEEAAAAYILGHLQRAGYAVRLEPVPVADAVRSTDVIGLPPDGGAPQTLVAVPYDTAPGLRGNGAALGVFLELARALRVARPRHSVEFVALGAERPSTARANLGSRRLAELLAGEEEEPTVITLEAIALGSGTRFAALGTDAEALVDTASRLGIGEGSFPPTESIEGLPARAGIFGRSGLPHVAVAGSSRAVGRVLLAYLL
jgi:hypothetical protein